jgi:hypothetical protein
MDGLDDCSILQPGHLVGSRLGGTHDSINVQNLRSHGFACTSSQAMSCATKEHLVWHDMRQTWVCTHATQVDQDLWISGQASLSSMPCGQDTKNWSHLGKVLSSTNWARSRSESLKASNALWTHYDAHNLEHQARNHLVKNPDRLSRLVNATLIHNGFECPSPWDYAGTKFRLVWGQNPYR